ncbi:Alpha/Beta hydrolase protein [Aspergillus similis]
MRDCTVLRGNIFRPAEKDGVPLPALFPWSPYGKTEAGYHQTTSFTHLEVRHEHLSGARGVNDSEGNIFILGTQLQGGRDGHDTIEWMAEQSWSAGNVALVGNSWLAMTQWYIAVEKPPHLKAIAPWEGIGDFYREIICRGGIPNYAFWDLLMQEFNKYPLMNDYWEEKRPRLHDINVPVYILASYSTSLHTEESIRAWNYAGSEQKWLHNHPTQECFDIYQPFANDEHQRFLDHFLLGKDNGCVNTPHVRVSLVRYNGAPIIQYQNPLKGQVSYQSDSRDDDGAHFNLTFNEPTELTRSSQAALYMSCEDLDDMDVYHQAAGITEKAIPDVNITMSKRATAEESDIAENRLGNREPTELFFLHDKEEKITPGKVVELKIPLWTGGIAFDPGETLRIEVKWHDPILPEYPPLHQNLRI